MNDTIQISRDVEAVVIPDGNAVTLHKDTLVFITQALGDNFTVRNLNTGGLYRIAGADADAIGQISPEAVTVIGELSESHVWNCLKQCYDPEIPVNIVDLGLIYSIQIEDGEGGKDVVVKMTLTAPGCGMGPVLSREAEDRIRTLPGVSHANVALVWDPPWSPERISAEGRAKLGMD